MFKIKNRVNKELHLENDLSEYAHLYQKELLEEIIPFWEKNSIDAEFGGYITCLDREGKVYDTDKFVWLQGRQVWMFAMLYNNVEKKQAWLDIALNGADFLLKNGRDKNGNWYFSLNQKGAPLIEPYNIFSDCFAAMAFGELFKATKNPEHKDVAIDTYNNILAREHNPKGVWNKAHKGTRDLKGFSLPMILCNLSLILEDVIGKEVVDKMVPLLIDDIMTNFLNKEHGVIMENVLADGGFCDSFEGRLVNPGHGNESMWFLMDLAVRYNDLDLIKQCEDILIRTTEFGWDQEFGGIYYFLDIKGQPMQELQWNQKLWWVHIETMISFAKAYTLTGNKTCKEWYIKLHDYTWKHFRDEKHKGEWFGYLTREGKPLLEAKGGKWKGCFHVPRGLYQLWKTLE
ncbi:AGE family epimerase/isomerase [Mariniflexile sp.]|uniref:AGE family epimerase/isomerase n=1 Tax=Mariniflexile sp. TaxID=1979402 RepID=UPI0040485918